jgi:lycopene cyclase domain-containing protein
MAIARHGHGVGGDVRALLSQVHPVFMLPPLAASWFGAAVAGGFAITTGVLHVAAMFCAVYTAHVKDGYVDFHRRGEDDDHPLSVRGCRLALAGATLGFAGATLSLGAVAGPGAAAITLPTWFVGYLHAPQLDTNPVTTTLGYPTGIALAILGGFYVQTATLTPTAVGFALVFLVTLAGVKIVDDEQDYDYDRSIDKRTVSVLLGRRPARRLAAALAFLGPVGVLWGTVAGLFPPFSPLAALGFLTVLLVATRAEPTVATMLLIRGAYVFLALLFVAVWFRPLSEAALPDITLLGPFTYLATEVVFGAVALCLLYYAGALRSAAATIAALYPVAYLWDWYTLAVGVFEIRLRTGYDLAGIPVEEHLFMVVVPALVLGIHETIRSVSAGATATPGSGADRPGDGSTADDSP